MKRLLPIPLIVVLAACNSAPSKSEPAATPPPSSTAAANAATKVPTSLIEAVHASYRDPANRTRDVYRHPIETLNFFGVQPEQTVLEIEPGKGWYTEILAPFLQPQGHYIAAVNTKYAGAGDWLRAHAEFSSRADVVEFRPDGTIPSAADGSADVVLTFRNCHNWIRAGVAPTAFASFFRALKPGGVLGVVDHRARAKGRPDPESGYVRERDVIALATAAGFKLDAKSEINANPKDTTKHPKGVWTLPPSYKLGEVDKAKYMAIGESDRMTIRFVKPR